MSLSVLNNPVSVIYDLDDESYVLYDKVITKNITALPDLNTGSQTILIGGSSNVDVEASENIRSFTSNGVLEHYFVNDSNGARYDRLGLRVAQLTDSIVSISAESKLKLSGTDGTVIIGSMQLHEDSGYQCMYTDMSNGFRIESPLRVSSSCVVQNTQIIGQHLTVGYDVDIGRDMFVRGNMFGKILNLWKDKENVSRSNDTDQVGYAFRISDSDQLEIVRYLRFNDSNATTPATTVTQRVAVFGNGNVDPSMRSDASSFNSDVLSGHVYNSNTSNLSAGSIGGSNNGVPISISSEWTANYDGSIFFTGGRVGIGMSMPEYVLHVSGTGRFDTVSADVTTTTDQYTISDERLKDVIANVEPSDSLYKVNNVMVHQYIFKDDPEHTVKIGFIAQEIKSFMQEAVYEAPNKGLEDCNHIETNVILSHAIGAIKQLTTVQNQMLDTINNLTREVLMLKQSNSRALFR
jgi:hypothetical protein